MGTVNASMALKAKRNTTVQINIRIARIFIAAFCLAFMCALPSLVFSQVV